MSIQKSFYESRMKALRVPYEIEPIPIVHLLHKRSENNIYLNCVDISRKAEHIVRELTEELRQRLQDLDVREDAQRLSGSDASMIEEIRREVESYRALPKPALIAIWEALYGVYPGQEGDHSPVPPT